MNSPIHPRHFVITNWRTCDEDLPSVPPGDEHVVVTTPPKFVILYQILVRDMVLKRLEIGGVKNIPFEAENPSYFPRIYRLTGLDSEKIKSLLGEIGISILSEEALAIPPGLEIRFVLRNEGPSYTKPRTALVFREYIS